VLFLSFCAYAIRLCFKFVSSSSYNSFNLVGIIQVRCKTKATRRLPPYSLILNPLQDWNWIKLYIMSRLPTFRPRTRGREGSLFNDTKLKKEEDIYRRFGLYKYSSFAAPHRLLAHTLVRATT
jgi:hypothetical protein